MEYNRRSGDKSAGIRLSRLHIVLIFAGLLLALLMTVSMYQTTRSVGEVVEFTNNYLTNQQTGGMLRDFSQRMSEQAMSFVQSGDVGSARSYEGQLNTINVQLAQYEPQTSTSEDANDEFLKAVNAFREREAEELRAMRLVADTLPQPAFEALPEFIRTAELSAEEQALSPEEKKAAATAILTAEDYNAKEETIRTAVDLSHRHSSVAGQEQAGKSLSRVRKIVGTQTILIILLMALAVLALVLNRVMILTPIKRSVGNLDRREPIPVEGCQEMRHLARVYNEVLKDNEEKTEALTYTATHDALTGVYNRDAFDKRYRDIEHREHYGVIMLDVDHFKQYNDEFGHDIGDRVLCTAVETMKMFFRSEDHISRVGGDEFCIIMPGTDQAQAGKIREKIELINRELTHASKELPPITISAGIAFWDRPNPDGSLLKDADSTLMELKKVRDKHCAVYGE